MRTRQRDELVSDLYYNQNKTYRQIAKEARICPRDIKKILDKDVQGVQGELPMSVSSKAYQLFNDGKSPLEVAIALNLREPHVANLYKECWNLKQLFDLNQMYLENKGNIAPLVKLYRLIKAAGIDAQRAARLLAIANNDLPSLENRYNNLKEEENSLEEQKRNSDRKLQDLNNQITESSNYIGHYKALCRQEETKLEGLRQLVRQFDNNDQIRKTIEEKIHAALWDHKGLLKLAFLCLTQSMRNDPEKYNSLIHYDALSTKGYSCPYYRPSYIYEQQQYQSKNYGSEDYMAMLVEEADKLCNKLPKELVDKIITDYGNHNSLPLPLLPPSEEECR